MRRIPIAELLVSEEKLAELAALLRGGGVAAIPTETFYALATDPRNAVGVERILRAKGRLESQKPLLVLFSEPAQLEGLGVTAPAGGLERYLRLWPAPLTVLLRISHPLPAAAGEARLAVRVPDHEKLRELLSALGNGLTATSANRSGGEPALDPSAAAALLAGEDAMVIDGGVLPGGPPSTLAAIEGGWPVVLRKGRFPTERLMAAFARSTEESWNDAHKD